MRNTLRLLLLTGLAVTPFTLGCSSDDNGAQDGMISDGPNADGGKVADSSVDYGGILSDGGGGQMPSDASVAIDSGPADAIAHDANTGHDAAVTTRVATSCNYSDVNAAIHAAASGEVVAVPKGDCTWSATNMVNVDKSITLRGNGAGATNITVSSVSYNNGALAIGAPSVVVSGFTFLFPDASGFGISIGGPSFRITGNTFTASGGSHAVNVMDVEKVYGLIDNNVFSNGGGTAELIFVRGMPDSWQTPHSMGGVNNVFIENNVFDDGGYVTDCNINSRCVVRFNTIHSGSKIDGHGKCTNTDGSQHRSVRHMEIYNNLWTSTGGYWDAMEIRGGTGRIFNNVSSATSGNVTMKLEDYASFQNVCFGYAPSCCCPENYPCDDEIGVGMDPKTAASEPYYLWNNKRGDSDWPLQNMDYQLTGSPCVQACGASYTSITQIRADRDYFMSATQPAALSGYTPYTCPHPLTGLALLPGTPSREPPESRHDDA